MQHRRRMLSAFAALLLFNSDSAAQRRAPTRRASESNTAARLVPNRVSLSNGKSFTLNLPEGFALSVAADGLKRVRFMAESPDGRVFVTDMYNLTDNSRGAVYILEGFDPATGRFAKVTPYLTRLRNPNSVAFHTDARGANWLYLAMTDKLVRFRYEPGDDAPRTPPETLATFPDYGLNYKYGGWHLTRTVAFGPSGKLYVSVGSSCNACLEKEEVRASVLEMDADGSNRRFYARGLRNAVGLRWVGGRLFATDMGADHLGRDKPADTMYSLQEGADYGWPFCYRSGVKILPDPEFNPKGKKRSCRSVPVGYAAFDAHSAPLGLEHFDASAAAGLSDSFLVALHGSTNKSLGRGYKVVRVRAGGGAPVDFITGFQRAGRVYGRPADIYGYGVDAFLLTDDHAGAVYYVYKKK
jgi:glucose/arabinose dehydrogenase